MKHQAKDYSALLGQLDGLSEAQLQAHFTLYQGYVNKLNEIEEKLQTTDPALANYSFGEFSELKRREAVAFNGSFLHEYYFENLNPQPTQPRASLMQAIEAAFGSFENLWTRMKASALSTPGWVLLTRNRRDGALHLYIMFEHHIGLPVDQDILLALDCWEHAFMIDYGIKKADYLAGMEKHLDWAKASERFEALS